MKWLLPVMLLVLTLMIGSWLARPQPEPAPVRLVIPPVTLPETTLRNTPGTLVPSMANGFVITDPDLQLNFQRIAPSQVPSREDFMLRCVTDVTVCADIPAHMLDGSPPQQRLILPQRNRYATTTGLLPSVYQATATDEPLTVLGVLPQPGRDRLRYVIPYTQ